MERKEDLGQIGEEGFEAIDRFFGQQQQQHYLHHQSEAPLQSVPSPYVVYRTTKVSQVPQQFYSPRLPRGFLFSRFFPVKQQNPPQRMSEIRRGFPPLAPSYVQYPPQEHNENGMEGGRVPASEAAAMNNFKAARLFGGITRVDRGWF